MVWAAKGEQCDDGNKVSGDGCSATCPDEPVQLALGNEFTCARSGTGLVKCWGDNSSGQLDLVDTDKPCGATIPVPSELRAIDLGTGLKATSISRARSLSVRKARERRRQVLGQQLARGSSARVTLNRGDKAESNGRCAEPNPARWRRRRRSTSVRRRPYLRGSKRRAA